MGTLISEILGNFDAIKAKYNANEIGSYGDGVNPVVGVLAWNRPDDVLWLTCIIHDEGYYEEQAEQWGINKVGEWVWAFASHCSCNSWDEVDLTIKTFTFDDDCLGNISKFHTEYDMLWKIWRENREHVIADTV